MGRPRKSDAPWMAVLRPKERADLDAIAVEAEELQRRLDDLTARRARIVARCRSRIVATRRKESEIELGKLRKQLAEGRKLAF